MAAARAAAARNDKTQLVNDGGGYGNPELRFISPLFTPPDVVEVGHGNANAKIDVVAGGQAMTVIGANGALIDYAGEIKGGSVVNLAPAKKDRYVVGFVMERPSERILLLRKNKPSWQCGLLNGVGGKVENCEGPYSAMVREWREEIGPDDLNWREFAKLTRKNTEVTCFTATTHRLNRDSGANDRGEELVTIHLSEIGQRRDVIRNLKWLLPLGFENGDESYVTAELMS